MRVNAARLTGVATLALAVAATGCQDKYAGGSELHARQVVLRREVEGLRQVVSRLERREPMLPEGDASIAISDSLVRDMIAAQLPLDVDVDRFHLRLNEADVIFRGSPVVRMHGTLHPLQQPGLEAQVDVIGALENIEVDQSRSILTARIAIDHLGIEKAAGLESVLSGSTLSEAGERIRLDIGERLPQVQIPIRVQQSIDLPAVTRGPVRLDGVSIPLNVAVSQVTAVRGRLWIALHFETGKVTKTADAPEAADATAADADVSLAAAPAGKGK